MTSLVRIKQTLSSINLTIMIFNSIGSFFSLFGLGSILWFRNTANFSEEEIAQIQASAKAQGLEVSIEELQSVTTDLFTPQSMILLILPILLLVIVTILFIINQGKIRKDQPSLIPYYAGIGLIIFSILSNLIQGYKPNVIDMGLNGIMFALYATGFYFTKAFLEKKSS